MNSQAILDRQLEELRRQAQAAMSAAEALKLRQQQEASRRTTRTCLGILLGIAALGFLIIGGLFALAVAQQNLIAAATQQVSNEYQRVCDNVVVSDVQASLSVAPWNAANDSFISASDPQTGEQYRKVNAWGSFQIKNNAQHDIAVLLVGDQDGVIVDYINRDTPASGRLGWVGPQGEQSYAYSSYSTEKSLIELKAGESKQITLSFWEAAFGNAFAKENQPAFKTQASFQFDLYKMDGIKRDPYYDAYQGALYHCPSVSYPVNISGPTWQPW